MDEFTYRDETEILKLHEELNKNRNFIVENHLNEYNAYYRVTMRYAEVTLYPSPTVEWDEKKIKHLCRTISEYVSYENGWHDVYSPKNPPLFDRQLIAYARAHSCKVSTTIMGFYTNIEIRDRRINYLNLLFSN